MLWLRYKVPTLTQFLPDTFSETKGRTGRKETDRETKVREERRMRRNNWNETFQRGRTQIKLSSNNPFNKTSLLFAVYLAYTNMLDHYVSF